MGQPPGPCYDPLQFALRTAHARGLELHAWFNPYRALHKTLAGRRSPTTISASSWPRRGAKSTTATCGSTLATRAAAQHSLDVMLDVVQRYDIDGVHMDDYFYPYPVKDDDGQEIPFPDDAHS